MRAITELIEWAEVEAPRKLRYYMNELVFMLALYGQGQARKMSFGPFDPSQSMPGEAWKIPVRQITGNYYISWKVRQIKPAVWQLYNDSREAFFIEFGINWLGAGRRVRRPILKMTELKLATYAMSSPISGRFWASALKHDGKGYGFTQIIQSPGHGTWMNVSEHEAMSVVRGNARRGMFSPNIRRTVSGFERRMIVRNEAYRGRLLGRRLS